MTKEEKQLVIDLFEKFQYLFYKVKVLDDVMERILKKHPDLITAELMAKIEDGNGKIAEQQLQDIENRIKMLGLDS